MFLKGKRRSVATAAFKLLRARKNWRTTPRILVAPSAISTLTYFATRKIIVCSYHGYANRGEHVTTVLPIHLISALFILTLYPLATSARTLFFLFLPPFSFSFLYFAS